MSTNIMFSSIYVKDVNKEDFQEVVHWILEGAHCTTSFWAGSSNTGMMDAGDQ